MDLQANEREPISHQFDIIDLYISVRNLIK